MGKFFKTSEFKTNSAMKSTLNTFNDYITHNETYNYFDTYSKIINNFLDGKRIFERPFGYVQTNNDQLYKFPGYTGDLETDYKNITDYLENLDECFNDVKEDEIMYGSAKHSYQEHQYFKKENGKLIFNRKLLEDIYDRKLGFDQKENNDKLNNLIKNNSDNTYDAFKAFKQTHFIREKRVKPKWYEFSKRIRNWKEEKALSKLENMLKAKGVKDEIINNAKAGNTITFDEFRKSFDLNEKNITDSIDEMIKDYKKKVDLKFDKHKEKANILKFLDILEEYKAIENEHDSHINDTKTYNAEEKRLKDARVNISSLMKFNTVKNQNLYKDIFHKNFNKNDIDILRNNLYNADENKVNCYDMLVDNIEDIAVDMNFNDENGKLIVIDDELFDQARNRNKKEELVEEEEELVEEKTSLL